MRLIYLSPDMSAYQGAMYQRDIMAALAAHAEVFFYGPGFPGYQAADTLRDIVAKAGFTPDWLLCGHAWLSDTPGTPVERFPIDLRRADIPAALFLNKEYVNLDAKLAWARHAGISLLFSHHHEAAGLGERAGISGVFIPFAADHRRFFPSPHKEWDLAFSGILQNPNPGVQTDLRIRVMQRLFECDGDVPLRPRGWCARYRLFYNALPRAGAAVRAPGTYRRLDDDQYAALLRASRVFLCTRSPADLVSPRYFECLASGAMVLAEASPAHAAVFPDGLIEEFQDESDFQLALADILESGRWAHAAGLGRREFLAHHTWDHRIAGMLAALARVPVPLGDEA